MYFLTKLIGINENIDVSIIIITIEMKIFLIILKIEILNRLICCKLI